MTDTLKTRVGRIVAGSFSALVDAIEGASPEMVMEQAIREIDQAISDVQADLGKSVAARHVATRQLADKNAKHEDLAGKISLAITAGRDDLAEAGIAAQLDVEAQIPVIEQAVTIAAEQERELSSYINALRAKKREMQDELAAFRASQKAAAESQAPGSTADKKIAAAEQVFERMMEKHGVVAGLSKADIASAQKLNDLDSLARDNRIKERLAKAKAGLQT